MNLYKKGRYDRLRSRRNLSLQIFFQNVSNNHYDYIIDKYIEDLKKNLLEIKNKKPKEVREKGERNLEVYFLEKQIFAISEMKIIYSYKHFETHLKFLLSSMYNEAPKSSFYRWDSVESFLKLKNIIPSEIDHYIEIRQLQNVNNSIKHSRNIVNDKTKKIQEFANKEALLYSDLLKFYDRVEDSPYLFLKSLSEKIVEDLHVYDEKRLDVISDDLLFKMNTETIDTLINKIESKKLLD